MALQIIGPYSTRDIHPDQDIDNSLCQAVRAGNHIFMRGQVGADLDGVTVGVGDAGAQADLAMRNVKQVLEEAGSHLGHIVKMTVYITGRAYRTPVYQAIGRWMEGVTYCSTGVIVKGLARPEWVVEIDAWAVIPEDA